MHDCFFASTFVNMVFIFIHQFEIKYMHGSLKDCSLINLHVIEYVTWPMYYGKTYFLFFLFPLIFAKWIHQLFNLKHTMI